MGEELPDVRARGIDAGLPWLATRRFRADQVQLVIRDDVMITARGGPVADVEAAWDRWANQCLLAHPHCGLPAYQLLDTIVDTYLPILDSMVEEVGEVERRLLDGNIDAGKALDLQDLFRCKRELAQFGRVVGPQRAAVTALWRLSHDLVHSEAPSYFQDVADHLARLAQNVDHYHDMLESTLNAYLVLVGNAKNDIMRRLTSATILAGIATAITAWFGNNFPAPEFELTFWYPLAMALTVGALGLGTALALLAITSDTQLLLVLLCGINVMEAGSVAIQMGVFKASGRKKRLFRMSPVHHHFELVGWPETTVIIRFWIISGLCVAAAVGIFIADFTSIADNFAGGH